MEQTQTNKRLLAISKKSFISVLIMLLALMVTAIVLTYIVPRGVFAVNPVTGKEDYNTYVALENESGIVWWKGVFAPFVQLGADGNLTIIFLSLFILVIAGAFQAMNDNNGIKVIITRIIRRFKNHRFLLLSIISLVFMLFGALLGIFEETLTLLPIIVILAVSLGYDSFTGFLVCTVSVGFGFSSAITNPFTVLFASNIIQADPFINVWLRILIFVVMYGLMELTIFLYTRRIAKKPEWSLTYERDLELKQENYVDENVPNEKKIFWSYIIFFVVVLAILITFSSIESLRDITVVALIAVFLIGGLLVALISTNFAWKTTFKSFGKGVVSAIPTIAFVILAASINYILKEGHILATIANSIRTAVDGANPYGVVFIILAIVLVLEFFISSSTAKAVIVMSILGVLSIGISKETYVLVYTLGDGYTNLLFPTSPVLLISLSMIGVSYFKWLKRSWPLFLATFSLVALFLVLAIATNY